MVQKGVVQMAIVIDLKGPQGNAFFLLGQASQWAGQLGLDTHAILSEMKSGDYDNLIAVFEKNFGNVATLINKPSDYIEGEEDWEDEE